MAEKTTTALAAKPRASSLLAEKLAMDSGAMIQTIKAQCFAGTHPDKITNEQLGAYINIANALAEQAPNFNPLLPGMLYAFPTKNGGIQPMIGPDGVFALLSSRPDVEGWETEANFDAKGSLVSATATIFMRNMRPLKKTCYLSEWKVGSNPNWGARPTHMLEIRALKQAARMVIHGIPLDREEVEIMEAETPAKREVPLGTSSFRSKPATAQAALFPETPAEREPVAEAAADVVDADVTEPAPDADEVNLFGEGS